ncbi:MAG: M48 family metalloprotease [Fimbriimonas sp.]|nr:M48 family metalloprotease [Fimbriimonas sp.]
MNDIQNDKDPLFKRITRSTGKGLGLLSQGLFVCVILFFSAASCSKDVKGFLSCAGISRGKNEAQVQFRPPNPKNETDKRLLASLGKLAKAGGMDLEKINIAIAVYPHINALTVGTDTFVLCEGLDKLSEESLDAVMAHEVVHSLRNHSERSSGFANTIAKATGIAGGILGHESGTVEEATSWAVDVFFAPYSQAQELEADSGAVELLKKAGYPLDAVEVMSGALDSIQKQEPDTAGGFLSTHPAIADRIKMIRTNSKNASGPLTNEQYWPAMLRVTGASALSGMTQLKPLAEEIASVGEQKALDNVAAHDQKLLTGLDLWKNNISKLSPPAATASIHKNLIAFIEDYSAVIQKQLTAAESRDKKRVAKAATEAAEVVERYRSTIELFASEMTKL